MKKTFSLMLSAAILMSSWMISAKADTDIKRPINDTEALTALEISWDEAITSIENAQYVPEMGIAEVKTFYNSGINSHYGYYDMDKRSDASERKRLYDNLLKQCQLLTTNYSDIKPVSYNTSDGSMISYDLPTTEGISHLYSMEPIDAASVYYIFRNDHPEYYWLSNVILYGTRGTQAAIVPSVYAEYASGKARLSMDEKIETSFNSYVEEIKSLTKQDNYTIALHLHNRLAEAVKYGYDSGGNPLDTTYAHSIIGIMDGDASTDAVCEGYAKTYQLLLNALNIDNIYVAGLAGAQGDYDNWGGHAWNLVKMNDGEYYFVDITWDDQESMTYTDYFAKGSYVFDCDHQPYQPEYEGEYFLYELPSVPSSDYDINYEPPATEPPVTEPPVTEPPVTEPPSTEPPVYERTTIRYEDTVDTSGEKCILVSIDKVIADSSFIFAVYDDSGLITSTGILSLNDAPVLANGGTAFYLYPDDSDKHIKLFLWTDAKNTPLADMCYITK